MKLKKKMYIEYGLKRYGYKVKSLLYDGTAEFELNSFLSRQDKRAC